MRFHKFISTILHPIVIPTLGVFLYFMFVSQTLERSLQLTLLGLVFVVSYVIPVLLLIVLKSTGLIENFQVSSIRERRLPVLFMVAIFYFLGQVMLKYPTVKDLGFLFYGTSISLICIYFLFTFKLKSSLHLVSMGNAIGFFLILANINNLSLMPIVIILLLLSGLLASSRLYLNAHTPKELVLGFFIGVLSQFALFFILQ
jgi:membrane-associated phospholipid phosphatase